MKLGIMGLGNIGQKAFLPIYITMHDRIDWVVYSRDLEKGSKLKEQYHFNTIMCDLDAFVSSGIEGVFIHTPTHTHFDTISKFLKKGIHVYVDKPLSEDLDEVASLYALARENNAHLFVGFNRRFAPMYQRLKAIPNKTMIVVQKNRARTQQDAKFAIFDMMSHVVDTALYLMDEPILNSNIHTHTLDGILQHATLTLQTKTTTVLAIMNMQSGAHTERVEVMSHDGHYVVENMDSCLIQTPASKTLESFGDWTPTLDKRGFKNMIEAFIETIQNNDNTTSTESSVCLTHDLLNQIYESTKEN